MNQIFLSYRRAEHPALIGRIYDRLISEFGKDSVFLDVDSIPLGVDFEPHLKEQVSRCTLFVAVIGREWLNRTDSLFRKDDFIRIELEAALYFNKPIIPLLVDVEMPAAHRLPPEIRSFTGRNGMKLDPGQDFHNHMARFIEEVGKSVIPAMEAGDLEGRPKFKTISQVVMNVIDEIQSMLEHPGKIQGLASHFGNLDLITNGFAPSGTYVFASEPNQDLAGLLTSIVQRILYSGDHSILWIETESNEEAVGSRILCSLAGTSQSVLRQGLLSRSQMDCLARATRFLQTAKISIISLSQNVRSVLSEQLKQDRSDRPDLIVINEFSSLIDSHQKGEFLELARFAKLARIPLVCGLHVPISRPLNSPADLFKESGFAQEVFQSASFVGWLSNGPELDEVDGDEDLPVSDPKPYTDAKLSVIMNKKGSLGEVYLNYWPSLLTYSEDSECTVRSWSPIVYAEEGNIEPKKTGQSAGRKKSPSSNN